MPRSAAGLTFRQERFCQSYLECGRARAAALEAGYAWRSASNHAYRLLRAPRIRARLAELQAETVRESCAGLESMLAKLQNVYNQAMEDRRYYAAARAVEVQSRLMGLGAVARARLPRAGDPATAGDPAGTAAPAHADDGNPARPSLGGRRKRGRNLSTEARRA